MSTRLELRTQFRSFIKQTDSENSDFTDSECNNLIDQAVRFTAVLIEYPRAIAEINPTVFTAVYNLPADFLLIRHAYFGNSATGKLKRLRVFNENQIVEFREAWLSENQADAGEPDTVLLLSRTQIYLSPPPDAVNVVAGIQLHLSYVKYPAALSSDSDSPNVPLGYHDFLPLYAASVAYYGKLANPELAAELRKDFMFKVKEIRQPVSQEKASLSLSFGDDDEGALMGGGVGGITP